MTTITILPEKEGSYCALAGDKDSTGRTVGEALDALTPQLSDGESGMLVIVQNYTADEFFSSAQQERLRELMELQQSRSLSSVEEQELETLVEVELNSARLRTESVVGRQHDEPIPYTLTEREQDLKDFVYLLSEMGSPEERQAVLKQLFTRLKKRSGSVVRNLSQERKRKAG